MNYDELTKEQIVSIHKDALKYIKDQQQRIDKAIEYIEYAIFLNGHNAFKDRILEILKGEDNE